MEFAERIFGELTQSARESYKSGVNGGGVGGALGVTSWDVSRRGQRTSPCHCDAQRFHGSMSF